MSISSGGLPRFYLHGFTPPTNKQGKGKTTLQEYINELPPLYAKTKHEQYIKEGLLKEQDPETLLRCDLHADIDLTRFITELSWEVKTELPYANCGVTLRMPSMLTSYIFHGRLADVEALGTKLNATSGFRHIEAGGWVTVRIPIKGSNQKSKLTVGKDNLRTVFFGRIQTIEISNTSEKNGLFNTSIRLTCTSFIHSFTLAEARKTPLRTGAIKEINPLAISESDSVNHPLIQAINIFDEEKDTSVAVALRFFVQNFGFFELPTSLAGTQGGKPARLGDHIFVMGDTKRTFLQTVYKAQTGNTEIIKGRPAKSALSNAMQNPRVTVWNLLTGLFVPEPNIMELFPTLIPLDLVEGSGKRGVKDFDTMGGKGSTNKSKQDSFYRIAHSKLVNDLGAIPALVYRYKPLAPNFEIDKSSLNQTYSSLGLANNPQDTYSSEFFAKSILEQGVIEEEETHTHARTKTKKKQDYLILKGSSITREVLTWNDSDRVNAVSYAQPFASASGGDLLLFGVDCVPLYNADDINRHGLRTRTGATPFTPVGNSEQQRIYSSIASSAVAERVYFTIGEGHAYGNGTIDLVYTPNPNLTAGIWIKVIYNEDAHTVPLYAYVHAVTHRVVIDSGTGLPSASTSLVVERASYGNRIPAVQYKKVKLQTAIERPESKTKINKRTRTRKGG